MTLEGVLTIRAVGTEDARVRLLSRVDEHVSPQVVFLGGGIRTVGAQEWPALPSVSAHVADQEVCVVGGVGTLRAQVVCCVGGGGGTLSSTLVGSSSCLSSFTFTLHLQRMLSYLRIQENELKRNRETIMKTT